MLNASRALFLFASQSSRERWSIRVFLVLNRENTICTLQILSLPWFITSGFINFCLDSNSRQLNELPTEVVTKIFSYLTVQEIFAGPGVACHRFYNIVKSCKELWRKLKTTVEFSVLSFRFIMVHAQNFEVLSLKYTQKSVRYNSPDSCKTLTVLDITSCIQLEEHHVLGLLQVCKQLPLLNILKLNGAVSFLPRLL